jgi:hypothetical protein
VALILAGSASNRHSKHARARAATAFPPSTLAARASESAPYLRAELSFSHPRATRSGRSRISSEQHIIGRAARLTRDFVEAGARQAVQQLSGVAVG